VRQAQPLYRAHCAVCHGENMTGNAALGAPDLTDQVWLYGKGSVFDIERTLLYGIRSGAPQTRNVTDMPAFGARGLLTPADINNVVQFLLQLNNRPYQAEAANEGKQVYERKANCGDCHGADAHGNPDYGAPDLTVNVWNSGGDAPSLYRAIYSGEHHVMPGWIGTLSLAQIRELAVYVYVASHGGE
jgi:cytochrome c oxidase cbb3-type subunit 3